MRLHARLVGLVLGCLLATPAFAQAPAAGSASATTLKLPDGPGSVAGLGGDASFDLFSAQVRYSVPFDLPSASGLAPAASLTYSGDLGNGPVGIGWSLAVPVIRRSLRHGVPTYTNADELELSGVGGGGRLVAIGYNAVLQGDEYRVEGQGNSTRVIKKGQRFEVTDADGVVYHLGLTDRSRIEENGKTAAWFVELVVNTAYERISYAYGRNKGQLYLLSMAWGPKRVVGFDFVEVYRADFTYTDRPDAVISYKTGFSVTTGWRLGSVRVESFGEELRKYQLTYNDDFPLSRLASVVMTGRGVDPLALPTLSFGYAQPQPVRITSLAGTSGWELDSRGVALFDVDGDGVSDLVRLEMGNHTYKKNIGGSFAYARPLTGVQSIELQSSRFVDLDGDARPELVRIVNDTWRVYSLQGENWIAKGEFPGTYGLPLGNDGTGTVATDLDGDGRTDLVRASTGGLIVNWNTGTSMSQDFHMPAVSPYDPPVEPGTPSVRFYDVNGDSLSDVVWITDRWMKVFLGRGDGTFATWGRIFYPWGQNSAVDINDLHLADLNRDGLMDLVRITAGNVLWFAGKGNHQLSFAPRHIARPESAEYDVKVAIADVNGNGSQEVVWSSPRGMWALDLAGATSAGMLERIDNGLGKATIFSYRGSGELAVQAEAASEPWVYKLPVAIPVVSTSTVQLQSGEPDRVAHYGVRDGPLCQCT